MSNERSLDNGRRKVKSVSSAATRRAETERPVTVNKRAAMLEAAAKLFASRGYDGTSMRDIAELVKVQPASLYHHFPSKSHILVSIYEESAIEMVERVERAIVGIGDPWEALEVACVAHMKALLAGFDLIHVVFGEMPRRHEGEVRQHLIAQRDQYENVFRRLIDAVPLRRGANRKYMKMTLLGAMAWSRVWYLPNGRDSPEKIARNILDIVRTGVES